jgi:hypothetical protein
MKLGTHVRIARSTSETIPIDVFIGCEGVIVEVIETRALHDCHVHITRGAFPGCSLYCYFTELEPIEDRDAEAFARFLAQITKPEPAVEMARILDARGGVS